MHRSLARLLGRICEVMRFDYQEFSAPLGPYNGCLLSRSGRHPALHCVEVQFLGGPDSVGRVRRFECAPCSSRSRFFSGDNVSARCGSGSSVRHRCLRQFDGYVHSIQVSKQSGEARPKRPMTLDELRNDIRHKAAIRKLKEMAAKSHNEFHLWHLASNTLATTINPKH
jgi:hypothetical protein